jgi:hypothetical protein
MLTYSISFQEVTVLIPSARALAVLATGLAIGCAKDSPKPPPPPAPTAAKGLPNAPPVVEVLHTLTVRSNGAIAIYVDGRRECSSSPCHVRVPQGAHKVMCEGADHKGRDQYVDVGKDLEVALHLVDSPAPATVDAAPGSGLPPPAAPSPTQGSSAGFDFVPPALLAQLAPMSRQTKPVDGEKGALSFYELVPAPESMAYQVHGYIAFQVTGGGQAAERSGDGILLATIQTGMYEGPVYAVSDAERDPVGSGHKVAILQTVLYERKSRSRLGATWTQVGKVDGMIGPGDSMPPTSRNILVAEKKTTFTDPEGKKTTLEPVGMETITFGGGPGLATVHMRKRSKSADVASIEDSWWDRRGLVLSIFRADSVTADGLWTVKRRVLQGQATDGSELERALPGYTDATGKAALVNSSIIIEK